MEMFIEDVNYTEHLKKYNVQYNDTLFCIPLVLMGHTSGIREFFKEHKDDTIARNIIYIKELISKCRIEIVNIGDYIASSSELIITMDNRNDLDSIAMWNYSTSTRIRHFRIMRKYNNSKQLVKDFRINGIDMDLNNSEIALIAGCCMFNYHFNKKREELKDMQRNEAGRQKLFELFRN